MAANGRRQGGVAAPLAQETGDGRNAPCGAFALPFFLRTTCVAPGRISRLTAHMEIRDTGIEADGMSNFLSFIARPFLNSEIFE